MCHSSIFIRRLIFISEYISNFRIRKNRGIEIHGFLSFATDISDKHHMWYYFLFWFSFLEKYYLPTYSIFILHPSISWTEWIFTDFHKDFSSWSELFPQFIHFFN